MESKFKPMNDEEMCQAIEEFGLFDGDNDKTFYAHPILNALDPEDMFIEGGKRRVYFELISEEMIDYIVEMHSFDKGFIFNYSTVLEINENDTIDYLNTDLEITLKKKERSEYKGYVSFNAPISHGFRDTDKGKRIPFFVECEYKINGRFEKDLYDHYGSIDTFYTVKDYIDYLTNGGDEYNGKA